MGSEAEIRDAVRKLTGTHLEDKVQLLICNVDAVDEDARTCDVTCITGESVVSIADVQLMAEVDDGWLLVPAIDSTVIVFYSTRNIPFVGMYSGLSKVRMDGGKSSIEIDDSGITLNDGTLGGLVQIVPLVTKINNLENLLNDLIGKYNSHTHNVTAVSAPTGPNLAPETGTITPTVQADLENTLITQGI